MERIREWPIKMFWYTKKCGKTIEEIIDSDPEWLWWAVKTFQNLTPKQAKYYKEVTGHEIPEHYIQDVTPYEYEKGDPESMYMDLCMNQDLDFTIRKWRGVQLSFFKT